LSQRNSPERTVIIARDNSSEERRGSGRTQKDGVTFTMKTTDPSNDEEDD
jgi:hypothetical protein